MRAMCEKVIPSVNCSWRYCLYKLNEIPFNWHYHPEYEICLTLNSQGVCHVGDHIAPYGDFDLVLLGPDLPHTWQSLPNPDGSQQLVHVAQIPVKWLEGLIQNNTDLYSLSTLLQKARCGVRFSTATAKSIFPQFKAMEAADPLTRFTLLMSLLNTLCLSEAQTLSSQEFSFVNSLDPAQDKFEKVMSYIYDNYCEQLSAESLAQYAHMSTNHFHRFFKKRTERTITEFINQLRIAKACKLLISSSAPISVISDQCGFNNISNFNRRFLSIKACTPSAFRSRLKQASLI
ncbi:helix-turn-helix domain-containing protein [Pseudoalteromonas sp. MMG013]|uniref:AraC family transcriptional regulator n=1 Tax=Pseudoalteromonas sp. MMG013 TaxID=2822687 RepID=UPI001B3788EE|nr:AraC family transcriptional regulator [Pseudoalteromonas sp. MMG013]MBQ4864022.1 helix-turn-helix domain-containing protein [Pseudoalteromonas sp. MMG013]